MKKLVDIKRVIMVYIREQSHTRAALCQFLYLDVVILIEDYLIPHITTSEHAHIIRCITLECGFAEYIEMEIGSLDVIDNMFLDVCSRTSMGFIRRELIALIAAGARNLKSGLTASVCSDYSTHIASILIAFDAIGTSTEYINNYYQTVHSFDVIDFITNNPAIGHLLTRIGTIERASRISDALQNCVKHDSIEMIEILISKLHPDARHDALNDLLKIAITNSSRRIIEYAIDAGADVHFCRHWVVDILDDAARSSKQRRLI
jgi:hypothetical protein